MPPKRKLRSQSNTNNNNDDDTEISAAATTKRSKTSHRPPPKQTKLKLEPVLPSSPSPPQENGNSTPTFDHSRPAERAGIINRAYYPPELSNERCALYNDGTIPRPHEVLSATQTSTAAARALIRDAPPSEQEVVIHWFKRDLRIRDNTALHRASSLARHKNLPLVALWILSPQDWDAHNVSPAKRDFELRSVSTLKHELRSEYGIPLHTLAVPQRKDVPDTILRLARAWNAKNLFCNIEYEVDELRREAQLVRRGLSAGVNVECCHDDCVVPPGALQTGTGRQYAVYTPWYRAWVKHLHANPTLLEERALPTPNPPALADRVRHLGDTPVPLLPPDRSLAATYTPVDGKAGKGEGHAEAEAKLAAHFAALYPAGEAAAHERLSHFLSLKIGAYAADRNTPSVPGTSCLSVHLAAGTLSARTCVRSAQGINSTRRLDAGLAGVQTWISEVAWRDFYRHVLVHWPYVCMGKPFKYEYADMEWEEPAAGAGASGKGDGGEVGVDTFTAWKEGRTGYPIVDAGMRSLNATGYMHNRVRMVTASFLAKHLLLDWRLGEAYFMSRLVDGDFASNNGGWGFSASTGVDPQPYFRVFNPWLQGERFDAEGEFVRTWVRELKDVKGSEVLNPWEGKEGRKVAKREGYPRPIVEHKFARARCLERYKKGVGRGAA